MLGAIALAIGSSSGCWRTNKPAQPDAAKVKKKAPTPPFDQFRVFTEPNEKSYFDPKNKEHQRVITALKPGHWTGVLVQTQANLFDFSGRLESTPVDGRQNPISLEQSPFRLAAERDVTLPKGQRKALETLFFAPRRDAHEASGRVTWISNTLYNRQSGKEREATELIAHMPSYQYYMVVLAREPHRYGYLKVLDSIRPPAEFSPTNIEDANHYRVLLPPTAPSLALPSEALCWTSIAYLIWDDILPSALSPAQQEALIDWLHWGGQLVVSGPDSLDKLRGSVLERYLPATSTTVGPLDPAALAELAREWTLPKDETRQPGTRPGDGWSGIELTLHPEAEYLPGTGKLLAERRVGRGRVVLSAFRLSEPDLAAWRSYDSFFNACILRHPSRKYDAKRFQFDYVGEDAPQPYDPRLVSSVRFLTRDERQPPKADEQNDASTPDPAFPDPGVDRDQYVLQSEALDLMKGESGVGGWDDTSWISSTARQTLRDAAGISVPQRAFVLKMVGLYLLVVVVANWLLFRLIGRVEWAWYAVPVIAVGWGALVIWLAQLDIGFARSETEVAVLETQPGYARGHLTRYTALYSSLSTSYDVHFDEPSALALPVSHEQTTLANQSASAVTLAAMGDRELLGFPVVSNSTGMIHSEEMVKLGGGITWSTPQGKTPEVTNGSRLKLRGAAVVRRRQGPQEQLIDEVAWLGDLEPGETRGAEFLGSRTSVLKAMQEQAWQAAETVGQGTLSLQRLLDCATRHDALAPGEVRLVGWHDDALEGMHVSPAASQSRRATLVVAHLEFGAMPAARPDENLRIRSAKEEPTP